MKVRPREINIFNMSLIDILCGALGAFCFMMLVLLPYYRPPSSAPNLRKEQDDTDELLKQLEQLKMAAGDPELDRLIHLYALNRGILLTPFHNMALMSPATTDADVDTHTAVFEEAAQELSALLTQAS